MLETFDYTIHIGSTPTFSYFDLYLYSAYTLHYVYCRWPEICDSQRFGRGRVTVISFTLVNKSKVVPFTCLHCYTSKPLYIMYALLDMKIYGYVDANARLLSFPVHSGQPPQICKLCLHVRLPFPCEFRDFYSVLTCSKMLRRTAKYQQTFAHVI